MTSSHGCPTIAEFLSVFPVLYRRGKNAKKRTSNLGKKSPYVLHLLPVHVYGRIKEP